MAFGSTLQALMGLARVALASVLLVGAPMADAAICAGEEFSSSTEASVASASDVAREEAALAGGEHDSQSPGDAQHCVHGHCHHTTAVKSNEDVARAMTVGATAIAPIGTDMVLAHVSAGLERPPKA